MRQGIKAAFPAMVLATFLSSFLGQAASAGQSDSPSQPQTQNTVASAAFTVPAGTKVVLAMRNPVWAKTAKVGDTVYTQVIFPVAVNNQIAIPAGAYVLGQIDALTRPSLFSPRAQFLMHFTQLIYPNGYTVVFQPSPWVASASVTQAGAGSETASAQPANPQTNSSSGVLMIQAAIANVYVQVSSRSDILLDNGTQIEMVLQNPVSLDAARVGDSIRRFKGPQVGPVATSSLCRPTPGTPGTPDTVIPGTPGTAGTPDTVIPGGPGTPDTVIPGTPATPGTPDTVIPGTPGTSGVACPDPPYVLSTPPSKDVHTGTFDLPNAASIGGKQLAPGTYQATWNGLGPTAQVQIQQKRKSLATVQARVVILAAASPDTQAGTKQNSGGTFLLDTLRFAGQDYALIFD
jgi:hypothetical protein